MPYAQYTQANLIADIGGLLSDPNHTYWSAQEIRYAIREGLREWSGIASYWRDRAVATGLGSSRYQDFSVLLPGRSRGNTYDSLIRELQYHFHEPASGYLGTGMSEQFSISAILSSIIRARNRFVLDSGIPTVWLADQPIIPNSSGRYTLPNSVAILRNLRWVENGLYYPLFPMDGWSFDNSLFANTTRPIGYSFVEGKPNQVVLFPNPINSGALEIIGVLSDLGPIVADNQPMYIPDDFSHAVKYATMSDLLGSDSESFDPFMADYCEKRYQTTLVSAKQQVAVISVQVNGVRIRIDSLSQLNRGFPNWTVQTTSSLTGTSVGGSEYDLLALFKRPAQDCSLTVDYITAAPIPADDNAYIQLGAEDIGNLTDYCQHYLSLKLGGREFKDTFGLYESFQVNTLRYAGLLSASSSYLGSLMGRSSQELSANLLRRRPDRDPIPLLERK